MEMPCLCPCPPRLMPESPRWLLSKGRVGEAVAVVRRVARVNGAALPPGLAGLEGQQPEVRPQDTRPPGLLQLLKGRAMLVRLLVVFFNWYWHTQVLVAY